MTKPGRVAGIVISLCVFAGLAHRARPSEANPVCTLDPALTRLFTPAHPQLGRYEVCTTLGAIADVAPAGSAVEAVEPLDAFGAAGMYDRSALARLYAGQRPQVARGSTQDGERFESVTLVSPYPDATLTRLERGTMVIRWTLTKGPT